VRGFQQSYPQFLGTPSKDLEKQQLTRVSKKFYELRTIRIKIFGIGWRQYKVVNAEMA
jgi:hypothetical protein